ncbi:MAG: hypothetical protein K2X38_09910 [Gemmataceae bacterium]|nr:hypothetical protein [Gemmataceae bacterium]
MSAVVEAPIDLMQTMSHLRLPESIDRRLQELMDLNNDGALTPQELIELTSLVELNEDLSICRASAMLLLKQAKP